MKGRDAGFGPNQLFGIAMFQHLETTGAQSYGDVIPQ